MSRVDPRSKKYYWLKLEKDFFKRHDIKVIEAMDNGKDYLIFYMKLLLESVSHQGLLRFNDAVPYNEKMLSIITDTNIDIVRNAVKIFTELHLMELLDDKTIYMKEVEKRMGVETGFAIEQRRVRLEKKEEARQLETMSHNNSISISNNSSNSLKENKDIDINTNGKVSGNKGGKINPLKETYYDNKELQNIFIEFLELRTKLKAVNSERAINALLNKLEPHSDKDKIKMIENSIVSSWKSIYDLKDNYKKDDNKVRQGETNKMTDDYWLQFETK